MGDELAALGSRARELVRDKRRGLMVFLTFSVVLYLALWAFYHAANPHPLDWLPAALPAGVVSIVGLTRRARAIQRANQELAAADVDLVSFCRRELDAQIRVARANTRAFVIGAVFAALLVACAFLWGPLIPCLAAAAVGLFASVFLSIYASDGLLPRLVKARAELD
jgi:hypothetical protein